MHDDMSEVPSGPADDAPASTVSYEPDDPDEYDEDMLTVSWSAIAPHVLSDESVFVVDANSREPFEIYLKSSEDIESSFVDPKLYRK
jgi:hypothetical protein